MAQLVKHLTSAQVMISLLVGSSPVSGSVLTAQSLKPVLDSVSLSLCPSPTRILSLSLKNKRTFKKINKVVSTQNDWKYLGVGLGRDWKQGARLEDNLSGLGVTWKPELAGAWDKTRLNAKAWAPGG